MAAASQQGLVAAPVDHWQVGLGGNLAIITLDSLRHDTAMAAHTPNLDALFQQAETSWHKVYAQGTYTLPSHVALFQSGVLPTNEMDDVPAIYKRVDKTARRMFSIALPWDRERNAMYDLPEAPNLVRAFAKAGYRTVGVGGVHWFDGSLQTSSSLWPIYFNEFHYQENFSESDPNNLVYQLELLRTLKLKETLPLFFFLNIATCHTPCRGEPTPAGQIKALEWIDSHLPSVLELLPKPCHVLLWSDHGTLLGEELGGEVALGHGFYHPLVVTVVAADFMLR